MKKICLALLGSMMVLTIGLRQSGEAAEKAAKAPPAPRLAATAVQRLGGAGPWNAYLYNEKSGPVCYLAGGPQKREPAKFKRKLSAVMVTNRPAEHVTHVVSFDAGSPLKQGSAAALDIDGTHFDLFTNGDTAWSRTSDLDKQITEAMAKGRRAVFTTTSQKGPQLVDTYSLDGFTAALDQIDKACGVGQ